MENKPSPLTASMGYGLILSLAMVVFSLVLFLLDLHMKQGLNYLSYVILIAGLLLAQLNYRNKHMGGFISYGKAFTIGMLTSLFVSLIMGLYTYIFFKFIDPGAMEQAMTMAEQQMMDRGMSEAEIEQGLKMAESFQTPGMYTFFAVAGNFVIGMVISLVTAIFVKKEDQGFSQPAA
jgi:hypothetical protein